MEEVWKKIKDYEDYQVSNYGRVLSYKFNTPKLLKTFLDNYGYVRVRLCKNGKIKKFRLHRLVASAFIKNPEEKETVNHKNGDKSNNSVSNLEWSTQSENNKHAFDTGLKYHSKETKKRMKKSLSKGTYHTPVGDFISSYDAAKANNCSQRTIFLRIKSKNFPEFSFTAKGVEK